MNHGPASRLRSRAVRALMMASALLAATRTSVARNLFPDPVLPAGGEPTSMAAADFNGDGKIDLAVASWYSQVSIFLARGDGEFEPARSFAVAGQCTWIATGDFNADGKIDLVVTEISNGISVFLGGGDGTFVFKARYPAGGFSGFYPVFVTVADLNQDSIPD